MTVALLGIYVLGSVLTTILIVPMWREDRDRLEARVNDLLTLLEAKAAPAEVAAYIVPPAAYVADDKSYVASDDGLIVVEVD